MTAREIVPRAQAHEDVNAIVERCVSEDTEHAAQGFIAALEKAYAHIARHPSAGSPRDAHELNLPGLRLWPVTHHPHLVFHVEHGLRLDVWRVLRGQQDIPAWMRVPDAI